jgi:hypothetical protein
MLVGDDICGYTLYKSHSEMPFKVVLIDRKSGLAKIVIARGYQLNYERRHRYSFQIAAHDCVTGTHTAREWVHIEVKDVNEFAPVFTQTSYIVNVPEKQIVPNILTLEATDQDTSDLFHRICRYILLTENVPFALTKDGVLSNTEPLDYNIHHNYILAVQAEDCGGKLSEQAMVNIEVVQSCAPAWKGVESSIPYPAGTGQKVLLPDAHLDLCDNPSCVPQQVTATVNLVTSHIGKGCDRDTYSLQSQRKLCGASEGSVDLLLGGNSEEKLPTDDGKEGDQIYSLDGQSNAIEVPVTKMEPSLGEHFTISTWMKHEEDAANAGNKEHILCHSDGEKMNRHHYSLFVHNCRLVLLLRQEPGEGVDMNKFKPAEWRWKIPQVCDGQWHLYAVSVDFPEVRLYVDGKLSVEAKSNPEVIDDWPLHKAKSVHYTKLVVGACWQGGEQRLDMFFKGYLAGLSILKGHTESDRVLQCLSNCKEKLDFHAMSEMETGMSISLNSEMTEIVISGHKVDEVEKLLHRVGYINSRLFPTPGYRTLTLSTQVQCLDGSLTVEDVNTTILVQQAEQPIISVSGPENQPLAEDALLHGHPVFGKVSVLSMTRQEKAEMDAAKEQAKPALEPEVSDKVNHLEPSSSLEAKEHYLDSCLISIDAILTPDTEHFNYPTNLIAQLGLEVSEMESSLQISGADTISNYEAVLRQINYVHRHPQDLNERTFTLKCTELNGRFISNELVTKVSVIHVNHEPQIVPQAHASNRIVVQPVNKYEESLNPKQFAQRGSATSTSISVVIIIVVCVAFLLFMIVLGVMRIRSAHQRGGSSDVQVDDRQEMEWDNSALTITVNPMDQENMYEEDGANASDSEDDEGSDFHED